MGVRSAYREAAAALGRLLAQRGTELVYGGGQVGLMGVLAGAALQAGGRVIGVIPQALSRRELARMDLTELHVVASMHERKAMMADLADAFIALPGGFGTCDEFCEMLTWAQLGIHEKPIGIVNTEGFFDSLLALFEHAIGEGFVPDHHRGLYIVEDHPAALLERMSGFTATRLTSSSEVPRR